MAGGGRIKIDIDGLAEFMRKVEESSGDELKKEVVQWLDACGMDFLKEVQDQIIAMQVVDTRLLLNSFHKGGAENVWRVRQGGLTLDIGTKVKYAKWVNDGHFTGDTRWVPGVWVGDDFHYTPGADTGMLLKAQWVDGRPYWDTAIAVFERMFEASFERKFKEWIRGRRW